MPGALRRAGGAAQRRLAEPGSIPRSGRRSFRSPHTNRPACVAIASCMEKGPKKKRAEARLFISHDDAATAYSAAAPSPSRSEEHTSELQSLMRISYAVFCLNKKKKTAKSTQ